MGATGAWQLVGSQRSPCVALAALWAGNRGLAHGPIVEASSSSCKPESMLQPA